jgi:hypothetical protein
MTTEQFPHLFAHPLQSNRMLSSSEEAAVRGSYGETKSSISPLEVQIKDLLLRHHALCNHRQILATLLSPVRRLPPELLGEIFRHCLPQDYQEKGAHQAVMLPSHVCKHWRDVALSTPALWTNIDLHVTDETLESRVALLTTWFSRSGGSPLSFTLDGKENVRPLLAFLLQHCNRWQCINLRVPFNEMLRCLEAAKGHLQCLETVRIYPGYSTTSYAVEHIFESAPRLRNVSLNFGVKWNGHRGSWPQLVELDAGYVSYTVGECLALLQSMRNLQKLRIDIGIHSGVVKGHRHFVFSHPLISLHIRVERAHGMLFDHITMPNLQHLSVEMNSEWPCQITSFLERSSPLLQSFSVEFPMDVGDTWEDNLTQALQHIPSLHSLCLVYNWCEGGGGSFVERLSPRTLNNGQVDCLIPKLNTISIQLENQLISLDYEALKKMVILRNSMAHNTPAGDHISGPIERIQRVEVICSYDSWICGSLDDDDDECTMWHEEVSAILAPLQGIVDIVQVVID